MKEGRRREKSVGKWRIEGVVVKVFLRLGSAYVSPQMVRLLYWSPPTRPRPSLLPGPVYCSILGLGLRSSPFGLLLQTRLPLVQLLTELHNFCRVPHYGASLPRNAHVPRNCNLNSLPRWLQKFLSQLGLLCLSVFLKVLAPVR